MVDVRGDVLDVDLNVSIISACLTSERDVMKSVS